MTTFGAFLRLVPPGVLLFLGLLAIGGVGEVQLIRVAVCGVALAWLVIATVQVARSLQVTLAVSQGRVAVPATPVAG